jgi:hypothetical protein
MGTTFTLADERIHTALRAVMQAHHAELHNAGVRVGILLAYNPDGPAVKHHGAAARATIKIVPLKDRLTKNYDAEMLIDQAECDLMRAEHLNALMDHELSHLILAKKKRGETAVVRDDLGRPKLKTIPGDWNAGDGFKAVVARHGGYAAEFENLRRAMAAAEAAKSEGEARAEIQEEESLREMREAI